MAPTTKGFHLLVPEQPDGLAAGHGLCKGEGSSQLTPQLPEADLGLSRS